MDYIKPLPSVTEHSDDNNHVYNTILSSGGVKGKTAIFFQRKIQNGAF